jgi:hypothetical protein
MARGGVLVLNANRQDQRKPHHPAHQGTQAELDWSTLGFRGHVIHDTKIRACEATSGWQE